jgi:phospholipase/lecithinase/hemolysin
MRYVIPVISFFRFTLVVLFFGSTLFPAHAAYSSLYVFGDALSTTTNNPQVGPLYYGKRQSNGRVWVEVLAQRQGLVYDASKNNSYYDHNSAALVTQIKSFSAPDVANGLFIVWVCNADTFDAASVPDTAAQWNADIKQSQANHLQIITNLYAKGVRTLLLPNAVDISKIPAYNKSSFTSVMQSGCIAYNLAFSNTINQARVLCPDLKIFAPDYFTLLNNVLTNAAYYGLTNALANGYSIDALDDLTIKNSVSTNGQGANYVFWDKTDPTAKFHAVIADVTQQIIAPVQISKLTVLDGVNQLDVENMPVGLNGFVDGITATNNAKWNWVSLQNFSSANTKQKMSVIAPQFPPFLTDTNDYSGSSGGSIDPNNPGTNSVQNFVQTSQAQVYRLRFPYAWNWP